MAHLIKGRVNRYELAGIHALNFVLTKSLGMHDFVHKPSRDAEAILFASDDSRVMLGGEFGQVVEAWHRCKSTAKVRHTLRCCSQCRYGYQTVHL
jgi:hypothetical protein